MKRMTLFSKILIIAVVLGGGFGLFKLAQTQGWVDAVAPTGQTASSGTSKSFTFAKSGSSTLNRPLRVGVVTWGGYAGGQYFNRGFKPNPESQYRQKYGFDVEFVLMDDFVPSREAFKAGSLDLLWGTVDSFPSEVAALHAQGVKILFQADWSRGGDAVVVRRGINSVNDLKGKKIAVAFGTPSHTFLLWLLNAGDLTQKDVQVIEVPSAINAGELFKAQRVDAAVVWSPDDEDCVSKVNGAKVLKSTRDADHIIADVFYVKEEFLTAHKQVLVGLVEGWLAGAAEINTNPQAKATAAKILAEGLSLDEGWASRAIGNARLATYGDNVNFFNLTNSYTGVTGEDVYSNMAKAYNTVGLAPEIVPAWRQVVNTSVLSAVSLSGPEHSAEASAQFTAPTTAEVAAPAFSTKRVSITFDSGSATLDDNAKQIIDLTFAEIARSFGRARIRVEGNTDDVGPDELNKGLSQRRAKAVAEYLSSEYHFDPNRFVVVGNGESKPVAPNTTPAGRAKNRRTDFELLSQE